MTSTEPDAPVRRAKSFGVECPEHPSAARSGLTEVHAANIVAHHNRAVPHDARAVPHDALRVDGAPQQVA
jgi:hypothetical protein